MVNFSFLIWYVRIVSSLMWYFSFERCVILLIYISKCSSGYTLGTALCYEGLKGVQRHLWPKELLI